MEKKKNEAAVALGKKRWEKVKPVEISKHNSAAATSRWENATAAERTAQGQRLAEARAKAKKKRAGEEKKAAKKAEKK